MRAEAVEEALFDPQAGLLRTANCGFQQFVGWAKQSVPNIATSEREMLGTLNILGSRMNARIQPLFFRIRPRSPQCHCPSG